MSIETLIKELKLYKKSGGVWMQISEEQIEEIIKEYQSEKWISIEDKLPEYGEIVLVTQHKFLDKTKSRYYTVGYLNEYGWHESETEDEMFEPTHWQPLPEPPEDV